MKASVLKGHLDGMLLATLEHGSRHGYAIGQELLRRSAGALDLPTGTIYPALHRLERAGLIEGEWEQDGGRRRRMYQLTRSGRRALERERHSWHAFTAVVTAVLTPPEP
jgi:transcriptional regulator